MNPVLEEFNEYEEDIKQICLAFAVIENTIIDKWTAYKLWRAYSDSMACGWCGLPDSKEDIVNLLYPYYEEVKENAI